MGTNIDRAIEIALPVRTVYDQWTQFEDFPLFMDNVDEVEQISDDQLTWHTRVRGVEREWRAQITEQIPDKRIAWTSVEGPRHAGAVTFHRIADDVTRVMLQFRFEPEGFLESYADTVGLVENWVDDELESFKEFIEKRGRATGEWRGEIDVHTDEPESGTPVSAEGDGQPRHEDRTDADEPTRNDDVAHDGEHRAVDHRAEA
jgi:uncharacterized membrane protein